MIETCSLFLATRNGSHRFDRAISALSGYAGCRKGSNRTGPHWLDKYWTM